MEVFKINKNRIDRVNKFMRELIEATKTEEKVEIYKKYEKELRELNPLDIFYLDFYSNDTSLTIEEIKESANRFVNVFHHGISRFDELGNHQLFKQLFNENKRIQESLARIKPYYQKGLIKNHQKELLEIFKSFNIFDIKFQKYENVIFSYLEKVVPSNKPLEVLWQLHDDSKKLLKSIIEMLQDNETDEDNLIKKIGLYHYLIFGINQKEELILLPVMNQLVNEELLNQIYNECLEIGFVFSKEELKPFKIEKSNDIEGYFTSKTGKLSFRQLVEMLNNLPLDITFVDKDDVVKYYNNTKNRHFPRTPAVIGRLVKNCHPPKSVHIVEEIISDFKHNKKDMEEFWINFKDLTIYIAYYAIRDESGSFMGVLEVSQDISRFINLKGEKRLR